MSLLITPFLLQLSERYLLADEDGKVWTNPKPSTLPNPDYQIDFAYIQQSVINHGVDVHRKVESVPTATNS